MALQGAIARRYAEAVFDLGKEHNSVERWQSDVKFLAELFANRRLAFVLSEPKIAFSTKQDILRDLAAQQVQPDALGLAFLLVEGDHVDLMGRISTEFARLYDIYRNQVRATVTSAVPLDAVNLARVKEYLQRLTGKTVLLQESVDPAILGGVIARVGDTLIDASVRRRLAVLREDIVNSV